MAPPRSDAVLLWDALASGVPIPRGTGAVVVDATLCVSRIRPRYLWPADLCFEVFSGVPVRQALAICGWAERLDEEEQIGALRNWRERHDGHRVA